MTVCVGLMEEVPKRQVTESIRFNNVNKKPRGSPPWGFFISPFEIKHKATKNTKEITF